MYKWAAIIESWCFTNFDEKHHGELERELRRDVDFTWINIVGEKGEGSLSDPLRWQENKQGESLLSVHRKRSEGG